MENDQHVRGVEITPTTSSSSSSSHDLSGLEAHEASTTDRDALALAAMGYEQVMQRNFSILSVLGVGFSLTNSWFGISASLVTGINSGGPVLVIYGIIIIALISTCVGISLSELVSAMPSSGGQYVWAYELAPRKYARFSSYLTGWISWAGSIFTSASLALALALAVMGCYQLSHPDFAIQSWHVIIAYECINMFAAVFNCYGRTLPYVAQTTLFISLVSFTVILITVPSVAPTHQDFKFVFATFINNTGWEQNGIAFIVGLVNTNWAFACLDCATHLSEEVAQPERMIPIAIMGTITIGFVTAWFYSVSMFFSIVGPFDKLISTTTGVPILELFHQALTGRTANIAGAIVLESFIIATGLGSLIASHTWQSRLCWSFSRDGGIPYSSYFSKIDQKLDVPLRAHIMSSIIVAIVGTIYLGSYTAFNSMITACIVLLYISYSIPVFWLILRGRNSICRGPFWMGPIGLLANIVLLAWTLFTLIMYSFPYTKPVSTRNMNYVSAVYGVLLVIISGDWLMRGRRTYRSFEMRFAGPENIISRESSQSDEQNTTLRRSSSFAPLIKTK